MTSEWPCEDLDWWTGDQPATVLLDDGTTIRGMIVCDDCIVGEEWDIPLFTLHADDGRRILDINWDAWRFDPNP